MYNCESVCGWMRVDFACVSEKRGGRVRMEIVNVFNTHFFHFLCKRGCYAEETEITDAFGYSPMLLACIAGDAEIVRMLCDRGVSVLQMHSQTGMTTLFAACERGEHSTCPFFFWFALFWIVLCCVSH